MKARLSGGLRAGAALLLAGVPAAPANAALAPPFRQQPSPYGPGGSPLPGSGILPSLSYRETGRTPKSYARRQNAVLLHGPFPRRALVRGISDGALFRSIDPATRRLAFARSRAVGASTARIPVGWIHVARGAKRPIPGASDPANPSYDWSIVDAGVRDAVAAGLEPLLVIYAAPPFALLAPVWRFATADVWDPDPAALASFATALAKRYDGHFSDPAEPGRALPRVHLFQAWNEPNLGFYLEPQWIAAGRSWAPFSPTEFRDLLNATYAGIKRVDTRDLVIAGGIAPTGDYPDGIGRMSPVTFVRSFLCLDLAPGARCSNPPRFDALAFHPLSTFDPDLPAPAAPDAAIVDLAKITRLLAAARHRGIVGGRPDLWITELNWTTGRGGVRGALQAHWISRALHRLWVAGATAVIWQFLADGKRPSSSVGRRGSSTARPAGLYRAAPAGFASDRPKRFATGFRFPFDPLRHDAGHVLVWGMAPPGAGPTVVLERRQGRRWSAIATLRPSRAGMLLGRVGLRGAAQLRLRAGRAVSAGWHVGAGPFTGRS